MRATSFDTLKNRDCDDVEIDCGEGFLRLTITGLSAENPTRSDPELASSVSVERLRLLLATSRARMMI